MRRIVYIVSALLNKKEKKHTHNKVNSFVKHILFINMYLIMDVSIIFTWRMISFYDGLSFF